MYWMLYIYIHSYCYVYTYIQQYIYIWYIPNYSMGSELHNPLRCLGCTPLRRKMKGWCGAPSSRPDRKWSRAAPQPGDVRGAKGTQGAPRGPGSGVMQPVMWYQCHKPSQSQDITIFYEWDSNHPQMVNFGFTTSTYSQFLHALVGLKPSKELRFRNLTHRCCWFLQQTVPVLRNPIGLTPI